jgi:hypothetical protein
MNSGSPICAPGGRLGSIAPSIRASRPPGLPELLDWRKEFNTQINKTCCVIQQVIANFKT